MKFNYLTLEHRQDTQDKAYQWQIFSQELKKNKLNQSMGHKRTLEIFYSRLCLKNLLKTQSIDILWRDLLNKNYLELQKHLSSPLSLSHSKQYSLAAISQKKDCQNIGVDIEHCERKISEKVQSYISHNSDIKINPIELWCLKEASYKAVSRNDLTIRFKDICVQDSYIEIQDIKLNWQLIEENSHVLAICWK